MSKAAENLSPIKAPNLSPNLNWAETPTLKVWVDNFLRAKKAEGLSKNTLIGYTESLGKFAGWCALKSIANIEDLTPDYLRQYLLYLEEKGHNPGGVHRYYRAMKTLLIWYENEVEPERWRNPIRKVKAPKLPDLILEPVELETVRAMIEACAKDSFGVRDEAIMRALLDTGARAHELIAINLEDVDMITGEIAVKHGKGGKYRAVFLGQKARKALRAYVRQRHGKPGPLFLSKLEDRLTYPALREIVRRRARQAGKPEPSLHDFRRAFAINFLRNGGDLLTLQRLLGHADMQVLKKYAKQTTSDLQAEHHAHAPGDSV